MDLAAEILRDNVQNNFLLSIQFEFLCKEESNEEDRINVLHCVICHINDRIFPWRILTTKTQIMKYNYDVSIILFLFQERN